MKKIKEAVIEEKNINEVKIKAINDSNVEQKKSIIEKNNKLNKNIYNKFKKCIKNSNIYLSIVITFVVCLGIFGLFYKFYLKDLVIETTRLEKSVTITDTGIADAVEKVYDSVVVVKTYVRNQAYSTGTGFVFKNDDKYGYILTNYHVISNASSVEVTLTNNDTVEANIVGSDEYSDIAILAIDKEKIISTAQTGSSEDMRVGDTTFAVGAPIDSTVYSWSVTRGILSGKNRLVEVSDSSSSYVMEVLQTDTAINSGNSGGPLCNSNGEVIGITNMKLTSSSIEGMGFAIPIEKALEYANNIINGIDIKRPYLGISIYDSNSFFNSTNSEIFIESVEKNSPAASAGLEKNDKILEVNGTKVSNTSYFKYELYKYNIGDEIIITILRNSKEKEIKITLGSNSVSS